MGQGLRISEIALVQIQMPLNKTLHWFFFPALWDKQAMERSEDLATFNSPAHTLWAWPKRKWIFCILFHVIFVAFKSNIYYSCDMRNGFSILRGDTVCESAFGHIQKGPLSLFTVVIVILSNCVQYLKRQKSFLSIWFNCVLFFMWRFVQSTCSVELKKHAEMEKSKIKRFCLRDALMWEKMHWHFGSDLYCIDANPLY